MTSVKNNNSISDDESQSEEEVAFEKFQEAVNDLEQDDKTLLRFLRAREHNLQNAENMIRKSMKWREENDISSYINWVPPKSLDKEFKITHKITGTDHDGRLVVYVPIGGFLAKECIEAGRKEDIFKWLYHMLETALKGLKESGHTQVIALLGLENLTYRQIVHMEAMQTLYQGFQILEQNYPEVLKHFFVINAPWLFSIAYAIVKPILSAHTISKLQIYDSNKSKWMPRLLEVMPIESVPEQYLDD